ncbi:patatin-like protein 2 [Cornus florida]|uniref:patatin-like protein 2 n=1 Tax=Cornus florida TaxID=4283 RepID=UPI0028A11F7E|nr:patatin-like protein 2 [Cornus florida]
MVKDLLGPKHSGRYLRDQIRTMFGETRISQALTNLVIHAFAIRRLHPIVFSTNEGKSDISKDATLSDISIGSTATTTYFPPYYFEVHDTHGCLKAFNLVDENPKSWPKKTLEFFPVKPSDYGKFLVISLGTGTLKRDKKYSASKAAKWGVLKWLRHNGKSPIVAAFTQASSRMVDFHMPVLLQALGSKHNYLRIQEDELQGNTVTLKISTKKNMRKLVTNWYEASAKALGKWRNSCRSSQEVCCDFVTRTKIASTEIDIQFMKNKSIIYAVI